MASSDEVDSEGLCKGCHVLEHVLPVLLSVGFKGAYGMGDRDIVMI